MNSASGSADGGVDSSAVGEVPDPDGNWPSWWEKYRNDWRREDKAPPRDGLRAPTVDTTEIEQLVGTETEVVLAAARRRHDLAEARIARAEERAARLAQTALAVLALAFAVTGLEATRLRASGDNLAPWLLALPGIALAFLAIGCLVLAAIQAIGIDRVGLVEPTDPREAAKFSAEVDQRKNLALQELLGVEIASWTATNKLDELLQARAWFTRGVTFLIASGLFALAVLIFVAEPT